MLLQNEYRQQLNTLDTDIGALYACFEVKLREHLQEFSKIILQKKENKYWRDKNAFGKNQAYRWHQDKNFRNKTKKFSRNQDTKNDYNSDTPSNTSSSASSYVDRPSSLRKRKGPFAKQRDIEGELQQVNKNKKGVYSGKGKTTKIAKDWRAIPKTQTQLDDFLDKISMTQALTSQKEQEPIVTLIT